MKEDDKYMAADSRLVDTFTKGTELAEQHQSRELALSMLQGVERILKIYRITWFVSRILAATMIAATLYWSVKFGLGIAEHAWGSAIVYWIGIALGMFMTAILVLGIRSEALAVPVMKALRTRLQTIIDKQEPKQ